MALKPDDILPVMASHGPDVVGGQQAPLSRALVAPEHPAGVDLLGIGDQVALHQGHFVCVRCRVAEHGLVTFLWTAHGHLPFILRQIPQRNKHKYAFRQSKKAQPYPSTRWRYCSRAHLSDWLAGGAGGLNLDYNTHSGLIHLDGIKGGRVFRTMCLVTWSVLRGRSVTAGPALLKLFMVLYLDTHTVKSLSTT